jgi:alkaline phosphatase D
LTTGPALSTFLFDQKGLYSSYTRANPSFGLPELPGIFTVVSYNDVDFFLLDDRTYRDSDRLVHTAAKSLYGAAQLRWLKNALLASSVGFKVIAGGSQFLK